MNLCNIGLGISVAVFTGKEILRKLLVINRTLDSAYPALVTQFRWGLNLCNIALCIYGAVFTGKDFYRKLPVNTRPFVSAYPAFVFI